MGVEMKKHDWFETTEDYNYIAPAGWEDFSQLVPKGTTGRIIAKEPQEKDGVAYYQVEFIPPYIGFVGWLPETILPED